MEAEKNLLIAERLLEAHVEGISRLGPCHLDAQVEAAELLSATRMLVNTEWGYLAAITGLDSGPVCNQIEVLYHFCAGEAVVTLRLRILREQASIPSVSVVVPFACYFEQELSEMFGINFEKPANPIRLFAPGARLEGVFPPGKDTKP
jgi:NADH:ubiquinone oxidoreductase subunit C